MSDAVVATGIELRIGDGASPEGFTDVVPELMSITPPARFRNPLETTTHNDGEESHLLGIRRSDTIPFKVNWIVDDPIHQQLESDYNANTQRTYQVAYPDGTTLTFRAAIERLSPVEATPDSVKQLDCALRKAGPVTVAFA